MLVEFKAKNFRSIRDEINLSLIASPYKDLKQNLIETDRFDLLKSVVVYGANASGKSNLMNAMVFMRWFVINSSKESQASEKIRFTPFKLNTKTIDENSKLEITFVLRDILYRYGFEYNRDSIASEWLYETIKSSERLLFNRVNSEITLSDKFSEGEGLVEKTRSNVLFISVVAQFNGQKSKEIVNWFQNTKTVLGLRDTNYRKETIELLNDEKHRNKVIEFIRSADIGISDLKEELQDDSKVNIDKLGDIFSKEFLKSNPELFQEKKYREVKTVHNLYDSSNKIVGKVDFNLSREESEGTKKYFNILGVIIESLLAGRLVIVDELDARLHPILVNSIVSLFNTVEVNKNCAQIVFTTHGTHILNSEFMRRDQIYFTEKNKYESTDLYPLTKFKPRNDISLEKNYIAGRYGAIPFVGDLEKIFCDENSIN